MSDTVLDDELTVLETPSRGSREQILGKGDGARIYAQAPLGIVGKLRLFQVLADALDLAMRDDGGKAIAGIFGIDPAQWDGESVNLSDIQGSVDMMGGLVKLAKYAPDIVLDIYCVALRVPSHEWNYARQLMELPVEDGGLNDEDGMEILDIFIEQNQENFRTFFVEKLQPLVKRMMAGWSAPSASSKLSKVTAASTRKASKS